MKNTTETKPSSGTLEIKLPRFVFKNPGVNGFLLISIIIFSFLLGMLTNKVLFLEKKLTNQVPPPANQEAAVPTPPPVIGDMTAGKLPLLGNKNAKVTVVEFSDFQCPFCKKYFDEAHKELLKKYVDTGKVQFAYRHFPLNSIHPLAQKAAEAGECANEQKNFWKYHDLLFAEQQNWSSQAQEDGITSFTTYAEQLGMNPEQFRTCLESEKYKARVDEDLAVGGDAQVDGTPTFFINGVRVIGAVPFAELQKVIEEELKK